MDSAQTLHDFVLNLLNDPTALTGFASDPQGALAAAGLGDVSVADVHDVVTLVVDYAPAGALNALETAQSSLAGMGDGGPTGAIEHLTALTSALGNDWIHVDNGGGSQVVTGAVNAPELGTAIWGEGSVANDGTVGGALGIASPIAHYNLDSASLSPAGLESTAYSAMSDVTGALDSDTINRVTGGELNASALSGAAAFATNLVSDPTTALSHPTEIVNALTGEVSGLSSALPAGDPSGAVTQDLTGALSHVPAPGDLTGALTGALGNIPGAGDLGDLGNLGNVTGLLGNIPGVGDLGGLTNVGGLSSGLGDPTQQLGNLTHDPVGSVTSHLPAGVTDLVNSTVDQATSATSNVPVAGDAVHTATSTLHSAVSEVTSATSSASPLDGLNAGGVSDTVSHATSDVTSLVHNVLPLDTDHPLL